MIDFEHVSLQFENKIIFQDLNFSLKKGERASLSGGSGKGKTSLLKLVQGYLLPDVGTISINGVVLSPKTIHAIRKEIAWIPQNINLPVNSGMQLIRMMDLGDKINHISGLIEQLGLDADILHENFSKISGGQKQRVVISVVLSLDKSIILMDEPTSSLDYTSIKQLLKLMDSLKSKTVLSASHHKVWNDHVERVIEL